jgi:tRNA A-37 threonylcarbamoyl transferase component Bud32
MLPRAALTEVPMDPDTTPPDDLASFLRAAREGSLARLQAFGCGTAGGRADAGLLTPDELPELADLSQRPPPGMVICKFGSRSVVGGYQLRSGREVILKYYHPKGMLKRLTYGLRGSRCHRSWIAALGMRHVGVPTPGPLAVAEWTTGCWWNRGFLATTRAEGVTLRDWVAARQDDAAALQAMAAVLRGIFDLMASHRIVHGDLKATNLIVDASDRPVLVDLDAVGFLVPAGSWPSLRDRDRRIFESNWRNSPPVVSEVFSGLFTASAP